MALGRLAGQQERLDQLPLVANGHPHKPLVPLTSRTIGNIKAVWELTERPFSAPSPSRQAAWRRAWSNEDSTHDARRHAEKMRSIAHAANVMPIPMSTPDVSITSTSKIFSCARPASPRSRGPLPISARSTRRRFGPERLSWSSTATHASPPPCFGRPFSFE